VNILVIPSLLTAYQTSRKTKVYKEPLASEKAQVANQSKRGERKLPYLLAQDKEKK